MREEQNQRWWNLLKKEIDHNLNLYKKENVVTDFQLTKNKEIETESFAYLITIRDISLLVDIYNAHKTNGVACELVKANALSCAIKVYETSTAEDVCLEIFSAFEDRRYVLTNEDLLTVILAPQFIVQASTSEEDMRGIDGYIRKPQENSRRMPLQIKSTMEDLEKHKEQYPTIPAIAYTHRSDWKTIKRCVKRIYRHYCMFDEVLFLSAL